MWNGWVNAKGLDLLSKTHFGLGFQTRFWAGLSSDECFAANKLTSTASSLNQPLVQSAAVFHDIVFVNFIVSTRGARQLADKDAAPPAPAATGAKTISFASLCKSE
jgi:hypothetical protein